MRDAIATLRKYTCGLSKAMTTCGPDDDRRPRQKNKARGIKISSPSDFRREKTCIPGLSDDELFSLREKALASQVGIMDPDDAGPARHVARGSTRRSAYRPMSSTTMLPVPSEKSDDADEKSPMLSTR